MPPRRSPSSNRSGRCGGEPLREERHRERQEVPRAPQLVAVPGGGDERAGVGHGDGGQRAHEVGVVGGEQPGHVRAPVVADQVHRPADDVDQRDDVGDELGRPVGPAACAGGRAASSRAGRARGCAAPPRAGRAATASHDDARSGKPCSSTTGSPSSGPVSRTSNTQPSRAYDVIRCVVVGPVTGRAPPGRPRASARRWPARPRRSRPCGWPPAASRSATAARRLSGSVSRRGRGRAGHDDGHLAAHAVGGPGDEVGERAAPYLLVGLGELAAHGRGPVVAERLGHRGQRGLGAVGRLEEDHRARLVGQAGQPPRALAGLARAGSPRSRTGRPAAPRPPARSAPRTAPAPR